MKDSGDVLTDLADMQALRQFSADLKELIDEQHAAGAIPANPLAALRERLMKVVDAIKVFKSWQEEQLKELAPFRKRNPKVSLGQINSMISALPPVVSEEQDSIQQIIASCDASDWLTYGPVLKLQDELSEIQQTLLPEFSAFCDGDKVCLLAELLSAEVVGLQRLAERHQQQAAVAAEIESSLLAGNYRAAQAKAKAAKLLTAEGESQMRFTDIDFAKQAGEIGKCDKLVGNLKRHLTSNNSYNRVIGEVMAYDLHQAEPMLNDARGEFREDLSAAAGSLKAKIAKAKAKAARASAIAIFALLVVILLAISGGIYANYAVKKIEATEKKARADQ